ncbi:cupin domain-containing protein [Burkholderia cenocepacia]|uniref:cupin domain-containing protein n=1 Tax=Burkholderia cenocepacia TaxID=95486 RepID=UPI001904FF3D|nr:cupin domain-containing protein [Burkholderia cenocepacia]MBJ9698537.1 cupin domain-containing protein [Burkholderia cenocepacia]
MGDLIRRVVIKQDEQGQGVVFLDDKVALVKWTGAKAAGAVMWSTAEVPVDNSDLDLEGHQRNVGVALNGGSVFRITEFGPDYETPMHRTLSADYCFVLSGELELVLDSGQTVTLRKGDAVVQRGTNHAWRNSGNEPRKIAVCTIEASPVVIDGQVLRATPLLQMIVASLAIALKPKRKRQPDAITPDSRHGLLAHGTCVGTSHDRSGHAVIDRIETSFVPSYVMDGASEIEIWRTATVPPSNNGKPEFRIPEDGHHLAGGSSVGVLTLARGGSTGNIHTDSIDYCLILEGEADIELDDDKQIHLGTGESAVLRGVRHRWWNRGPGQFARVLVFRIASRPKAPAPANVRPDSHASVAIH